MCGILAVYSKRGPVEEASCLRALDALGRRGPDFRVHTVWRRRLFLGQTVLSITGDPPEDRLSYLQSPSLRYHLLYQGEIYNFRDLAREAVDAHGSVSPRYGTDTEVLAGLHDYLSPAEVYRRLDGMFAYVLLDRRDSSLYVGRDVQGEKSLYLYEDADDVIVSSELSALRILRPSVRIDPQALRDYFRTRHLMLFGRTVFSGVREVPQGTLGRLDLRTGQWRREVTAAPSDWIDPDRFQANRRRTLSDLAAELESVLAQCAAGMTRLKTSYAAVVSGGVDSSLVARMLARVSPPGLLLAIDHVGKDRISRDLSAWEHRLGHPIRTLRMRVEDYAAFLPAAQALCGGPLFAHSCVGQYALASFVHDRGVRVLFGGDGADELFGGYDAYLGPVDPASEFSPSPYLTCRTPQLAFNDDRPEELVGALREAWRTSVNAYAFVEDPMERTRLAMMYGDTAYQLPQVALRGAELLSMGRGVEARSLFLRRPVMSFALNLPLRAKVGRVRPRGGGGQAKLLLKRLFRSHFSRAQLKPKQGFAGFPNEAGDLLGDPRRFRALDELAVRPESLIGLRSNPADHWKLANVEYFLRAEYRDGRLGEDVAGEATRVAAL